MTLSGEKDDAVVSKVRKRKQADDEDEVEEVPIDADELRDLEGNVVVPRAKRRAAIASGLVPRTSAVTKKTKSADKEDEDDYDDDEEAEFEC